MEEAIGTLAGVFTTIGVLPQIYKAIRTKRVKDINPYMFVILLMGVVLWTVYGVLKDDWAIILTNGISVVFNTVMLIIILTQNSIK